MIAKPLDVQLLNACAALLLLVSFAMLAQRRVVALVGEGGEIFILRMGTPVKIADMARDLIHLSGKEPDVDIKIVYTGLREGEKLYEELITVGEDILPTSHEKVMVSAFQ